MKDAQAFVAECNALTSGQTIHEILVKALSLLSDETKWCQLAIALNKDCRKEKINSRNAVAWSIEGAIGLSSNPYGIIPPFILKGLDELVHELTGKDETVGWFNDHHNHEAVLGFMQEAIRRAGG
jgi:hypothetical protein